MPIRLKAGEPQVLITVRVSREDALFVRQMAGRHKLSVSDYIRSLLGLSIAKERKAREYFTGLQRHE